MPVWGEVELLSRAVYEEGRKQADEILNQARIEARRIVAEAEAQAEKKYRDTLLSRKSQASGRARQIIDTAELESGKRILSCREQVMSEILNSLEERLAGAVQRPGYPDFLMTAVNEGLEALKADEFIVEINPRDAERVKDGIERLSAERSLKIRLTASASVDNGVRIYSGDRRRLFDNTLQARLNRRQEEIRREIWRKIFGSEPAGR